MKKQWISYLDFWHNLCYNKDNNFIIKPVVFDENFLDVGLFVKNPVTLRKLSQEISGFLEEINETTFQKLQKKGHPSLFVDDNYIDTECKKFSPVTKYYILYGSLSLANSYMTQDKDICFTNKDTSHLEEPLLATEIVFTETSTEIFLATNSQSEVKHDINNLTCSDYKSAIIMRELNFDNDNFQVKDNEITYMYLPSVTNPTDFKKSEFVYKVMFGVWDRSRNTDFEYKPDSQILIKYCLPEN